MRIAIYEPESFLGGMLTWGLHLRAGFRALGHEADLVTFTRSGRARTAWSSGTGLKARPSPYDHVGKLTDAAELLSSYDGVVQNDPISYLQDAAVRRPETRLLEPGVPDYISILRRVTCPITTTVHCGDYSTTNFPFREEFRSLPTLTGTVVTHSLTTFHAGVDLWPDWSAIAVPLPYEAHRDRTSDDPWNRPRMRRVGITGRYTAVKGHRALAAAAAYGYLNHSLDVELWGSADVTAGPSATVMTYDELSKHGLTGEREPGSASVARPWRFTDGTRSVTYVGGYLEPWQALDRLDVHVNLTTTVASGGAVEYSQLEAMDAGCQHVSPAHRWESCYVGEVIPGVHRWPSDRRFRVADQRDPYLVALGDAIDRLYQQSDVEWESARRHNYDVMRRRHDPAMVAEAFIHALGAKR